LNNPRDSAQVSLVASLTVLSVQQQESRAVARKLRDAAAVLFGLKFAENIHYKFKSSQPSKAAEL